MNSRFSVSHLQCVSLWSRLNPTKTKHMQPRPVPFSSMMQFKKPATCALILCPRTIWAALQHKNTSSDSMALRWRRKWTEMCFKFLLILIGVREIEKSVQGLVTNRCNWHDRMMPEHENELDLLWSFTFCNPSKWNYETPAENTPTNTYILTRAIIK